MKFKRILLHVYAENPSESLLETGRHLAEQHDAELTIVDVAPEANWLTSIMDGRVREALDSVVETKATRLEEIAGPLRKSLQVVTRVLRGKTSLAIVREVIDAGHDLVIREVKGEQSLRTSFFGTTTLQLLRKCPCPVLALKRNHTWPFAQVAAAVDATLPDPVHAHLNSEILELAKQFSDKERANLHVVTAWALFGASVLRSHMPEDEFENMVRNSRIDSQVRLDTLLKAHSIDPTSRKIRLIDGEPVRVLPSYMSENQIDLLVMGSIARSGLSGMVIGNIAEQILNGVECSVLVLKPLGYKTPLTFEDHAETGAATNA